MTLLQVIEALVFASPKPLLTKEIVAALRAAGQGTENQEALEFAKSREDDVLTVLAELQAHLGASGRAFQLVERVNGWTMVSDPSCAPWVRQLYPEAKPTRLTGPQLETLAIIAYRQPVTRADIEAVRGVAVDGVMQILLDRGLVKIAGRAEVPGRPLLYSTTEYFLEHFGLKTTDELPNASELKRVVLPTAAPATETPAAETPAGETPVGEIPAGERSAEDLPANEIPAESTVPEESSTEPEPPAEEPPPVESATSDSSAESPTDTPETE